MDMESQNIPITPFIKAFGKKDNFMAKENLFGPMVHLTRVSILEEKNKDLENLFIILKRFTKGIGQMGSSKGKECY